jgi:hypothetical protein
MGNDMAEVAGTPGALVWILFLAYIAWKTESLTFPLSNALLTR